MWLDNDSDGCMYDTVDCNHICRGCYWGICKCPECGTNIEYDEKFCECGYDKDKLFFEEHK